MASEDDDQIRGAGDWFRLVHDRGTDGFVVLSRCEYDELVLFLELNNVQELPPGVELGGMIGGRRVIIEEDGTQTVDTT